MIQTNWFGRGFKLRAAITIACQMVGNTLIRLQCVCGLTVSQAFILFGYDQGVFSGIVGNEDWLETFGYPDSALEGIIVSIYNLGAFSGCIVAFVICEKTGRRLAMWIAMGFIIVRTHVENRAKRRHLDWQTDFGTTGRWRSPGIRIYNTTHDDSPVHHRHWNRHRDFDRTHVSIRAL